MASTFYEQGETIGGSVAAIGSYSDVAVLCHLTPGAVGQDGNELCKRSQCGWIGVILVEQDMTPTCGENVCGLNNMNNCVMANVLTTPQSQDNAAVTTKKSQKPKL